MCPSFLITIHLLSLIKKMLDLKFEHYHLYINYYLLYTILKESNYVKYYFLISYFPSFKQNTSSEADSYLI